jgi:hypothetical protein
MGQNNYENNISNNYTNEYKSIAVINSNLENYYSKETIDNNYINLGSDEYGKT